MGRCSRLQADIRAMQHNSSTYCDEPEDTEAFQAWLAVRSALICCCEVVSKRSSRLAAHLVHGLQQPEGQTHVGGALCSIMLL